MTPRDHLLSQLMRDEGCRLTLYQDAAGKWTIGYGRNLDAKGISESEARLLLDHDLDAAMAEVLSRLPIAARLDDVRRAVLVNMAFNLGIAGLLGFRKFLAAVTEGDYARAASEMLLSLWAQQVGPRALRLARQMETGEWT